MTHNIIKTENYLLVVDDSEIKEGKTLLSKRGIIHTNIGWNYGDKVIIAHLPLNNSPVLEGVPLLPPLEDDNEEVWEQGLLAELEKLPYTKHLDDGQYNDGQLVGFQFGATWGYNKAKEKYKYTEEDLRNAIDMARKFPYITKGEIKFNTPIDEIIKFIQQPKIPVAFECEWTTKQMPEFHQDEPKTITNPQGQTVLVGKYIY
jgi:hypothetical protein